jgi:hypothetical protein
LLFVNRREDLDRFDLDDHPVPGPPESRRHQEISNSLTPRFINCLRGRATFGQLFPAPRCAMLKTDKAIRPRWLRFRKCK